MKLNSLTPMLRTWKLQETIAFYTKVLGFVVDATNDQAGWAALHREGVSLMLSEPNPHEGDKYPRFTGSLYFNVDDVEAVWQQVKTKAAISYPPETFFYGMREFGIYDNNGYLLQFGQEVAKPNE
ncbi:MAG: VOC family protein [Gemmatales bacterium]